MSKNSKSNSLKRFPVWKTVLSSNDLAQQTHLALKITEVPGPQEKHSALDSLQGFSA